MISSLHNNQTTLEKAQSGIVAVCVNSFLIDRKAAGLQPHTVKFYRINLAHFTKHCHANGVTRLEDVSPDLLRGYLLTLAESHNPGGVQGYIRTLRASFREINN